VSDDIMSDNIKELEKIKKDLQHSLLNNLYINASVKLVEPKTIERSMGKAVRVIDKRRDS